MMISEERLKAVDFMTALWEDEASFLVRMVPDSNLTIYLAPFQVNNVIEEDLPKQDKGVFPGYG